MLGIAGGLLTEELAARLILLTFNEEERVSTVERSNWQRALTRRDDELGKIPHPQANAEVLDEFDNKVPFATDKHGIRRGPNYPGKRSGDAVPCLLYTSPSPRD